MKCINSHKRLFIGLILLMGVSVNYVHALPNLTQEKPTFQLHVLKKNLFQLKLIGYNKYEEFWSVLRNLDLSSESFFVITEDDIESYNWPDQSIILTVEFSMKLIKLIFGGEGFLREKKIFDIEQTFQFGVFIVVFKGEKLYGGVFLDLVSSIRGGPSPVIVPQIAGVRPEPPVIQIRLVVRPKDTRSIFDSLRDRTGEPISTQKSGYKYLDSSLRNRIEIPEIREFFQELGKLTQDATPNRVEQWMPKIDPFLIQK